MHAQLRTSRLCNQQMYAYNTAVADLRRLFANSLLPYQTLHANEVHAASYSLMYPVERGQKCIVARQRPTRSYTCPSIFSPFNLLGLVSHIYLSAPPTSPIQLLDKLPFGMSNARKSTPKNSETPGSGPNDLDDAWTHVEHAHLSLENVLQGPYQYRPAGQPRPVEEKIDEGNTQMLS